jgi:hypothetical protein
MISAAARQTTLIFAASCVCIFIFFWVGNIFISTPQADIVALRLPSWDEAKWWMGHPDTGFYIDIAEHGYQTGPYSPAVGTNWAFFPAYPLLLRVLVHGRSAETYLVTGFFLSVLFYGLGVMYLETAAHRLPRGHRNPRDSAAVFLSFRFFTRDLRP